MMNEQDYERGSLMGWRAWRMMLDLCLKELPKGDERDIAVLIAERTDAVSMLRMVCAEHGDNDWPDDLHLGDVIEKHLLRHLDSVKDRRQSRQPDPD